MYNDKPVTLKRALEEEDKDPQLEMIEVKKICIRDTRSEIINRLTQIIKYLNCTKNEIDTFFLRNTKYFFSNAVKNLYTDTINKFIDKIGKEIENPNINLGSNHENNFDLIFSIQKSVIRLIITYQFTILLTIKSGDNITNLHAQSIISGSVCGQDVEKYIEHSKKIMFGTFENLRYVFVKSVEIIKEKYKEDPVKLHVIFETYELEQHKRDLRYSQVMK